jgi:hypothetical protein
MKGVTIQTLALLILAIIVLAIIAYLLYRTYIGSSPTITKEECMGRVSAACTACKQCYLGNECNWEGINVGGDCPNCYEICIESYPKGCYEFAIEFGIGLIAPDECKKIGIV